MAAWGRRLALALVIAVAVVLVYLAAQGVTRHLARFTVAATQPTVAVLDGAHYRVLPTALLRSRAAASEPAEAAAATMAAINGRFIDLLRVLRRRYIRGPDGAAHPARRAATERLLLRYNQENLAENSALDPEGSTSYSEDKTLVALCLRDGDMRLHDLDVLTFVAIHELAHVASDGLDTATHSATFWSTMRWLLEEAEAAGLYTVPDFVARPVRYCGKIDIAYSPSRDPAVAPL